MEDSPYFRQYILPECVYCSAFPGVWRPISFTEACNMKQYFLKQVLFLQIGVKMTFKFVFCTHSSHFTSIAGGIRIAR